jgi:Kef-type K+ transport system membrane component KefB
MVLLTALNFDLPLKNPVIIFSLVLFIILFAPLLLNKIKIPHIIGLILAGVIVGPYCLNLLKRDSSIVLFGTVGLLYIMFSAGLEIDMSAFRKNRKKILVFGLLTFLFPLIIGTAASYYLLGYSLLSSILLASMFSTHTLISFPIVSRYGISKTSSVTLTIGGTMITDILALIILAGVAGMTKEEVSSTFWFTLGISTILFTCTVFFVLPVIIRWFFKRFDDSVSQYIFVLAVIFLSSFLAEAAGLEAIIGAFFSGLILNKFIPHTSPLMNRIEFVGNALFIPFFLLSVGMLVDLTVFVKGWGAMKVAGVIVVVAIITKFLAAILTRKIFKLSRNEGNIIFGLSTSHAAATLAIILVGYNIIIGETSSGEPIRLLNEDVLNGTIILILVSCAISSFVVERASRQIALDTATEDSETESEERILITLADNNTVDEMVDFGLMLKRKRPIPVYALHVISDDIKEDNVSSQGKKMIAKAVTRATITGNSVIPIIRHDENISNGIIYTIKEQKISDLIIGFQSQKGHESLLSFTTERIVRRIYETIYIYKTVQPLNTLSRVIIAITPRAELEPGFKDWYSRILNLARESGTTLCIYGSAETIHELTEYNFQRKTTIEVSYHEFINWEDFLIFSGILKQNDLFTIVSSRKGHVSYQEHLDKIPQYLNKYFQNNSCILIYPRQLEHGLKMDDVEYFDSTLVEKLSEKVQEFGQPAELIKKIFQGK